MLAIGGFGAVVAGAGPGDALYGLRTMLFGAPKQVRDDQVALAAQTELNQVQDLIAQGDWQQAQDKLVAVSTQVESVGDEQQKQQLLDQWNQLSAKVVQKDPEATVPPGITYTVPPSATELVPAVVTPTEGPEVPPTSVPDLPPITISTTPVRSRAPRTTPSEGSTPPPTSAVDHHGGPDDDVARAVDHHVGAADHDDGATTTTTTTPRPPDRRNDHDAAAGSAPRRDDDDHRLSSSSRRPVPPSTAASASAPAVASVPASAPAPAVTVPTAEATCRSPRDRADTGRSGAEDAPADRDHHHSGRPVPQQRRRELTVSDSRRDPTSPRSARRRRSRGSSPT